MNEQHLPFDFSEITPLIFVGKNGCCLTHFDGALISRGVRADISLEEDHVDQPYGAGVFLWLPTKDRSPLTQEHADLGVATLKFFEERNISCYVHCKNGHGRAPMLVAAYFIAHRGMTADEAIASIKERRPSMHLEAAQIAFLKEYEKRKGDDNDIYVCGKCGFTYLQKDLAKACEDACLTKGICRTDLSKRAIADKKDGPENSAPPQT